MARGGHWASRDHSRCSIHPVAGTPGLARRVAGERVADVVLAAEAQDDLVPERVPVPEDPERGPLLAAVLEAGHPPPSGFRAVALDPTERAGA